MCSMPRDVRKDAKGSEEKGGPLSEKKCKGVPNWEKKVLQALDEAVMGLGMNGIYKGIFAEGISD